MVARATLKHRLVALSELHLVPSPYIAGPFHSLHRDILLSKRAASPGHSPPWRECTIKISPGKRSDRPLLALVFYFFCSHLRSFSAVAALIPHPL